MKTKRPYVYKVQLPVTPALREALLRASDKDQRTLQTFCIKILTEHPLVAALLPTRASPATPKVVQTSVSVPAAPVSVPAAPVSVPAAPVSVPAAPEAIPRPFQPPARSGALTRAEAEDFAKSLSCLIERGLAFDQIADGICPKTSKPLAV